MSSEKVKNKKKMIFLIALLALVIAIGTYAWFTFSQATGTDTATSSTGEDDIQLYISSSGGDAFTEGKEADIIQTSEGDKEILMPVSTADLKTFLCANGSSGTKVSSFSEDDTGKYYYKGRVYLKAVSKGNRGDKKLDIYLDGEQGPFVTADDDTDILNASRVGILFNEETPAIFWLSSEHNKGEGDYATAVVNGQEVKDGQVLTGNGGSVSVATDPAIDVKDYQIDTEAEYPTIPEKPMFTMEFNKIYPVDIFFYLEGCDSDCSGAIETQGTTMHVAFFGVLD